MANKKARHIPPTVKSQVAELAHSEPGMGSSAKVIAAMIRFRVKGRSVASVSAKAWASVRCGRYFAKGKQLLQVPRPGTFFQPCERPEPRKQAWRPPNGPLVQCPVHWFLAAATGL